MRKVEIDNCEVIGVGAVGKVFKLDEETVVKQYYDPAMLPMAQSEHWKARQALISGIPTAIPFGVVEVGNSYGTLFELIKAQNCNDVLKTCGDNYEEYLKQYADFIKSIHSVTSKPGLLPFTKDIYLGFLNDIKEHFPADITQKLKSLLEKLPEDNHIVHGDLQMKNVLYSNGEMILIDMDTLSTGNPVFDLAGLAVAYVLYTEDEPGNADQFLGISDAFSRTVYETLLNEYFDEKTPSEIEACKTKINVVASLRFLYTIIVLHATAPSLLDIRITHTIEHLRELLPQVDDIAL